MRSETGCRSEQATQERAESFSKRHAGSEAKRGEEPCGAKRVVARSKRRRSERRAYYGLNAIKKVERKLNPTCVIIVVVVFVYLRMIPMIIDQPNT